jgi:hypothetical protein
MSSSSARQGESEAGSDAGGNIALGTRVRRSFGPLGVQTGTVSSYRGIGASTHMYRVKYADIGDEEEVEGAVLLELLKDPLPSTNGGSNGVGVLSGSNESREGREAEAKGSAYNDDENDQKEEKKRGSGDDVQVNGMEEGRYWREKRLREEGRKERRRQEDQEAAVIAITNASTTTVPGRASVSLNSSTASPQNAEEDDKGMAVSSDDDGDDSADEDDGNERWYAYWSEQYDRHYYNNPVTGITSWTMPDNFIYSTKKVAPSSAGGGSSKSDDNSSSSSSSSGENTEGASAAAGMSLDAAQQKEKNLQEKQMMMSSSTLKSPQSVRGAGRGGAAGGGSVGSATQPAKKKRVNFADEKGDQTIGGGGVREDHQSGRNVGGTNNKHHSNQHRRGNEARGWFYTRRKLFILLGIVFAVVYSRVGTIRSETNSNNSISDGNRAQNNMLSEHDDDSSKVDVNYNVLLENDDVSDTAAAGEGGGRNESPRSLKEKVAGAKRKGGKLELPPVRGVPFWKWITQSQCGGLVLTEEDMAYFATRRLKI